MIEKIQTDNVSGARTIVQFKSFKLFSSEKSPLPLAHKENSLRIRKNDFGLWQQSLVFGNWSLARLS
jgi:hypothetical protein